MIIRSEEMLQDERRPGWRGRFCDSLTMSFSQYDIAEGAWIHEHHHPEEEVWIVLEGRLEVTVGGEVQVAGPGDVVLAPSDTPHKVRALTAARAVIANHPRRTYVPPEKAGDA
jgi:quercetin dioxygenase-like cupin family protein